jgi:hypothetical protein
MRIATPNHADDLITLVHKVEAFVGIIGRLSRAIASGGRD